MTVRIEGRALLGSEWREAAAPAESSCVLGPVRIGRNEADLGLGSSFRWSRFSPVSISFWA